jgi:hypothetical protein
MSLTARVRIARMLRWPSVLLTLLLICGWYGSRKYNILWSSNDGDSRSFWNFMVGGSGLWIQYTRCDASEEGFEQLLRERGHYYDWGRVYPRWQLQKRNTDLSGVEIESPLRPRCRTTTLASPCMEESRYDEGQHCCVEGASFRDTGLVLPLWTVVSTVGILSAACWWFGRQRPLPGMCGRCGYDLTGNASGVCPECGTRVGRKRSGWFIDVAR